MSERESLIAAPYWHVRKEDVHQGSATVRNPAFASFDVVLRRDYDELLSRYEFDASIPIEDLRESITFLVEAVSEWFSGDIPPQLRSDWRFRRAVGDPE